MVLQVISRLEAKFLVREWLLDRNSQIPNGRESHVKPILNTTSPLQTQSRNWYDGILEGCKGRSKYLLDSFFSYLIVR